MNSINSIISDVNNFSEKAMPVTSEMFYEIFSGNDSDACNELYESNDKLYKSFSEGLSDVQKRMFSDLEDDFCAAISCVRALEGFNGGFYIGFHLAMELLKGGELNG